MFILAGSAPAQTGSTTLVSRSSSGAQANQPTHAPCSISGEGRYVSFHGPSNNVVADDTNNSDDVFVHDRLTGQTTRVSISTGGRQGDRKSGFPDITPDCRYVAFASEATNFVPNDTNDSMDVFVRDRLLETTELVSQSSGGVIGDSHSGWLSISADGRYIAFASEATNLVPNDTEGKLDCFVRDRVNGTTTRVSVSSLGVQGNGDSGQPRISADGRFVLFESFAANLVAGDSNDTQDVFVHELQTGATLLVSQSTAGVQGNSNSEKGEISADGRFVAFSSHASNLVPSDMNGSLADAFVRDMVSGETSLVSFATDGTQGNQDTFADAISADGRYVVLKSSATNLFPGDTNGTLDILVRDRTTGATVLVSQSSSGELSNGISDSAAISADGRFVAFRSYSNNLVPIDLNGGASDTFVRDLAGCSATIATYCAAGTTSHGCVPSISGSGTPSASAGTGFTITVSSVEGAREGLIFYGISGPQQTPFGGGASFLCVRHPLQRTSVHSSGGTPGSCEGQLSVDWNLSIHQLPFGLGVPFLGGETVWAQAWFRDPTAPGGANLSDGLWFTVCP